MGLPRCKNLRIFFRFHLLFFFLLLLFCYLDVFVVFVLSHPVSFRGKEFSGRFSGKFPGATEHFDRMIRKFVFHFFKANFDKRFKAFSAVFVKWNCLACAI